MTLTWTFVFVGYQPVLTIHKKRNGQPFFNDLPVPFLRFEVLLWRLTILLELNRCGPQAAFMEEKHDLSALHKAN